MKIEKPTKEEDKAVISGKPVKDIDLEGHSHTNEKFFKNNICFNYNGFDCYYAIYIC